LTCIDGGRPDGALPPLTRSEAKALRRSAPLTHAQLRRKLDVLLPPLRSVE